MQSVRAVQSAARDKADLAAEELRDALLPLGLGAALREAPRDAALGSAVDVQRRRQAACAHDSESRHLLTGGGREFQKLQDTAWGCCVAVQ